MDRPNSIDAEDWDGIRKGGANGIFMVVIALFWWRMLVEEEEKKPEPAVDTKMWLWVVEDLLWVFGLWERDSMAAMAAEESAEEEEEVAETSKRALTPEPDVDAPRPKRVYVRQPWLQPPPTDTPSPL